MDIIKELEKKKQERVGEEAEIIDFAKGLLSSSEMGERNALRELGLDDHIKQAEEKTQLSILDKQFQEKYEGKVFHINELKAIAMRYRLFLKNTRDYRGIIPPDLGAIVHRMKEKHNLHLDVNTMNSDSGKFFIMAPPKMFKTYNTFWDKFWKLIGDINEDRKAAMARREALRHDPILFYRAEDGKHFVMLKKWGKDFTPLRRIKGFLTRTGAPLVLLYTVIMLFMVQLPFRAWQWADAWVWPILGKTNNIVSSDTIGNMGSYFFSHFLFFFLGFIIGFLTIRLMIETLISNKDRSWRADRFSTNAFFERFFKV